MALIYKLRSTGRLSCDVSSVNNRLYATAQLKRPLERLRVSLRDSPSCRAFSSTYPSSSSIWMNRTRLCALKRSGRDSDLWPGPISIALAFDAKPKITPTCRLFHSSTLRRYDRLQVLEDAANRDRDNANTQAIFMEAQARHEVDLT